MKKENVLLLLSQLKKRIGSIEEIVDSNWFQLETEGEINSYSDIKEIIESLTSINDDVSEFLLEQQGMKCEDEKMSGYRHNKNYREKVLNTYKNFVSVISYIKSEFEDCQLDISKYSDNVNFFSATFESKLTNFNISLTYGSYIVQISYADYVPSVKGGKRKITYNVPFCNKEVIKKVLSTRLPENDGDILLELDEYATK